jgi:hypothetical protein
MFSRDLMNKAVKAALVLIAILVLEKAGAAAEDVANSGSLVMVGGSIPDGVRKRCEPAARRGKISCRRNGR